MIRMLPLLLAVFACSSAVAEPWVRHTVDDSSRGADGVRLADVNGDGRPDIATGWEEGGIVRAYLNPGAAKAREPWPAVTVGRVKSPEDAVFVDLDGDGATDVISCCEGGTRTIFVHWAPGERDRYLDPLAWTTEPLPHSEKFALWMFCEPMQVDGVRGVDLVVGAKGGGAKVGWYESPEDPRDLAAWRWHPIVDAGWIMSLRRIDVDGDGADELVVSDRKGPNRGVWAFEVPEAVEDRPKPWPRTLLGVRDREVMFVHAARRGARGPARIAAAVKGAGLFLVERTEGTWSETEIPLPPDTGSGKGAAIVDVNLDGVDDLVFTCEHSSGKHGAMWLERGTTDGRTTWTPHEVSGTAKGVKFDRIEMLDLDGDGDADLLTCEERDGLGVIWYENPTR